MSCHVMSYSSRISGCVSPFPGITDSWLTGAPTTAWKGSLGTDVIFCRDVLPLGRQFHESCGTAAAAALFVDVYWLDMFGHVGS